MEVKEPVGVKEPVEAEEPVEAKEPAEAKGPAAQPAAATARDDINGKIADLVGTKLAALILANSKNAANSTLSLRARILLNLSRLKLIGQLSELQVKQIKDFVLSMNFFRSNQAQRSDAAEGHNRIKKGRSLRDEELARIRHEGDILKLTSKRYLRASLALVAEWEAEQAKFLEATLETVQKAPKADSLVSPAEQAIRAQLRLQLADSVRSSVQLKRTLDMETHALLGGKIAPTATLLGAQASSLKRMSATPIWALLDPPNIRFLHMQRWEDKLIGWKDRNTDEAESPKADGNASFVIHIDDIETCTISSSFPERVDLVLVSRDGQKRVSVDFKAVGTSNNGLIANKSGSRSAKAAAAWKQYIDDSIGYSRVLRPLTVASQQLQKARDPNQFYQIMRKLDESNSLNFILPLSYVRRQTAEPDQLEVSRIDVPKDVALLQRALRQGQPPHPMSHTNMDQVRKDMPRDNLRINGRTFTHTQGDTAVELLTNEILAFVRRSKAGSRVVEYHSPQKSSKTSQDSGSSEAGSDSTTSREIVAKHAEATALVFARRILLGSTRTVSGGDAYDAVEWLFGNTDAGVMICLDPSHTDPVSISFYDGPVRSPTVDDGTATSFSSPASEPVAPAKSSSRGPSADDFSMYPIAQVRTKNYFKLCCMEGEIDESNFSNPAAVPATGGTVTMAWVVAEFERSFSLSGHNAGTVCISAQLL